MKGELLWKLADLRRWILTQLIALILVGGFGTRLRPLVRLPYRLESLYTFALRTRTNETPDSYSPETIG